MKLGWENRTKTVAGVAFLSLAMFLLGRMLTPQAVFRSESALKEHSEDKTDDSRILDPTLRYSRLGLTENGTYHGIGRNIFRDEVESTHLRPSPAPLLVPPAPVPVAEQSRTTLRFFGFVSMLDVPRRGCFGDGDAVFVASEGQIVNRRYRILKIESNSVEVEDLIEHSTHKLFLPG